MAGLDATQSYSPCCAFGQYQASFMQKPLEKPSICTLSMLKPQPLQDTIIKLRLKCIIRNSKSPPLCRLWNGSTLFCTCNHTKTKRSSKGRHVTIHLQRQPHTCLATFFGNCLNILAKAVLKIYLGYFFLAYASLLAVFFTL